MRISLSAKNKTSFITGRIKEPDEASKPDEYALWQYCNDMVLSWILNSIEPELANSVLSCNTPHAIWEDLRERFSLGNAPCIFQIQRDIYKIEQGSMSVVAYYTKLKGLWDELAFFNSPVICTCGAQNDCTKLIQFLKGLNESYSGTRCQILLMNPLPSIRQAYASIAQEEKQRELGSSISIPSNTAAMAVVAISTGINPTNRSTRSFFSVPIVVIYTTEKQHATRKMGTLLVIPRTKPGINVKMIDDQDLGFFANFLGIFIFILVIAYHYVVADPKYEGN
ncbi:Uncharacterized protein M6B38_215820 [Iris pallida]|uniref:Dolichyl-diphosphooligosaccharide--protein glycosyltransferase subunit 4 n=1 Tax=Iris pallida TaxID=29817 RepID=A0AAX6E104_IRIPA|nr:Uncharacterized protein M6B38_215820 [Iris pallida]